MKHIKLTTVLILLLGSLAAAKAQKIESVEAKALDGMIQVTFNVETGELLDLLLSYSEDGQTFKPCTSVAGDLTNVTSGRKTILWDYSKDGVIMGHFVFKVVYTVVETPVSVGKTTKTTVPKTEQEKPATTASRAENKIQEKSKRKINYLIMLGLGSNGPSVLAGAKMMNNAFSYGAYIKYKYSVNNYQYTYSYYDYYYDYYGHYYDDTRTQDIKVASKSFIFGFLTGYRNLFMNIGIGYYNCGYRYGEHFEKYSNDDGIEFDLGLIYKIGIFGVGVGIGTVPSLSGFDSKTDVLFNFSAGFIF